MAKLKEPKAEDVIEDEEMDVEEDESEEEESGSSSEESEEEAEEEERADTVVTENKKSENITLKIKAISENPERKISPIVGYFSSGYNPLSKRSNDPENSRVKVYKSSRSRNPANPRMELVVGAKNSQVNFVGTNYSGEATAPQLCNYALGVLDKETGVLKMVPIAANRIFRLAPKVPGVAEVAEMEGNGEVTTEEGKPINRHTFAAKKDINRDTKGKKLRESETAGDRKDFVLKLGDATNAEALASTTDASFFNAQNLPPYNLAATTPEMAYPLDKIIFKGDWDCLLDVYKHFESGSELKPADYPSFVRNRISRLEEFKDETQRKRMASILSYITHLIKFKDKHSMDKHANAKHHRFPGKLIQKFSTMFSAAHDKRIPDDKLKLLINYIVVLSLIVDDFQSDPTDIAKDLQMSILTIRTHYGYLGCKMKGTNFTLPMPLRLETISRKRKQRKKIGLRPPPPPEEEWDRDPNIKEFVNKGFAKDRQKKRPKKPAGNLR